MMNRVKNYFNKPWNARAMNSFDPMPRFVHEHLFGVYFALSYTPVFVLVGGVLHILYGIGGWTTTLGCVTCLWWLSRIRPWKEFYRVLLWWAAAQFFGSSIGPLINLVIEMNQRDVLIGIETVMLFFTCYAGAFMSDYNGQDRYIIYRIGEFTSPIFAISWIVLYASITEIYMLGVMLAQPFVWLPLVALHGYIRKRFSVWIDILIQLAWISFLSYYFTFPISHLLIIYGILWALIIHITIFSQETIFLAANRSEQELAVVRTIAFFTHFPTLAFTTYRHFGGIIVRKIRRIVRISVD